MRLKLTDKKQEVGDIWSFFFEPVDQVEWLAGQSIRLELPRPTWGVDERRLTIASAPCEEHVQITTRLGESGFKQSLAALKPGDEIQGYNIEGDFVWGDDDRPRLFIAGGIGITPFRALLRQALQSGKPLNTTLIYSSKAAPALFHNELQAWQAQDPTLHVYYRIGERISLDTRSSLATFWLENTVYISGPEQMVTQIQASLIKQGIPAGQIKTDLFTGLG